MIKIVDNQIVFNGKLFEILGGAEDVDYILYQYYLRASIYFCGRLIQSEPRFTNKYKEYLEEVVRENLKEYEKSEKIRLNSASIKASVICDFPPTFYFDAYLSSTKRTGSKLIHLYSKLVHYKEITDDFSLEKFANQIENLNKDSKYGKIFLQDQEFPPIFSKAWKEWLSELNKKRTSFEHQIPKVMAKVKNEPNWKPTQTLGEDPSWTGKFLIYEKPLSDYAKKYEEGLLRFSNDVFQILENLDIDVVHKTRSQQTEKTNPSKSSVHKGNLL